MIKSKVILWGIILISLLSSCGHYESDYALSSIPNIEINNELTGLWKLQSNKGGEESHGYMQVRRFNKYEYLTQLVELRDSSRLIESIVNLRIFPSLLGEDRIYNVEILDDNISTKYMFFMVDRVSKNKLKIYFLSDEKLKLKFNDTESFRRYMFSNKKIFYELFEFKGTLKRVAEETLI